MVKEIISTQGMIILVDDEDYEWLSKYRWGTYKKKNRYKYYAYASIDGKQRPIHRVLTNAQKGEQVDHINQNALDNRKENLRICSISQNMMNVGPLTNNKSGYRGIYYDRSRNKWCSEIIAHGKCYKIGRFDNISDAIKYRDAYALQLHKEYAYLNNKYNDEDLPNIDITKHHKQKQTYSKYIGVSYFDDKHPWRSYISLNNKYKSLGYFKSEIEAALVYDEAVNHYRGNIKKLNFPAYSNYLVINPNNIIQLYPILK